MWKSGHNFEPFREFFFRKNKNLSKKIFCQLMEKKIGLKNFSLKSKEFDQKNGNFRDEIAQK